MSEKRIEFLIELGNPHQTKDIRDKKQERDLEGELWAEGVGSLPDKGNVFFAKKVEAEYQRRRAEEGRSL